MRSVLIVSAAVLFSAGASPVLAGNPLFESLARQAVDAAASRFESPNRPDPERQVSPPVPAAHPAPAAPAAGGARPRALAPERRRAADPARSVEFSEALRQRKADLVAFGKSRCHDCEGGYAYDTSVRLLVPGWTRETKPFEQRVSGMKPGDSFTWKGQASVGRFEVTGDQRVGAFSLQAGQIRPDPREASAERPGLFCFGKLEYSTLDEWIEVF